VNAGDTPGTIVVEATCGELSAAVSVVASCIQTSGAPSVSLSGTGAGVASSRVAADCPPSSPAAPPASLPDTGAGGDGTGGLGPAFWALIGAAVLVGASGVALAWRRRGA
jgi:hypothetical protein